MNLLLDTCTFLWLALPDGKLSPAAIAHLNNRSHLLYISDVSLWEITMKHSTGKLPLPDVPRLWLPRRLSFFQVQTLPLAHDAIFLSAELPRVHADPFDRLLAAQAISAGMTLISPDTPFSLLGASRIW